MRWVAKPTPRSGDVRLRKVFALWPRRVDDLWVWLERFWVLEKYHRAIDGSFGFWAETDRGVMPERVRLVGPKEYAKGLLCASSPPTKEP